MKIMAVDLGEARTGIAICDKTEFLASPVGVIHDKDPDSILQKVVAATKEYDVKMVVIGHPVNMDGTCGERAQLCEQFSKKLAEEISIPVRLWDERQSTLEATKYLNETNTRGKKRKKVIDQVAATIILESFMTYRKNNPDEQ